MKIWNNWRFAGQTKKPYCKANRVKRQAAVKYCQQGANVPYSHCLCKMPPGAASTPGSQRGIAWKKVRCWQRSSQALSFKMLQQQASDELQLQHTSMIKSLFSGSVLFGCLDSLSIITFQHGQQLSCDRTPGMSRLVCFLSSFCIRPGKRADPRESTRQHNSETAAPNKKLIKRIVWPWNILTCCLSRYSLNLNTGNGRTSIWK